MKNYSSLFCSAILLCICLCACKKKKSDPAPDPTPTPAAYHGVFTSEVYAVGNGTTLITYNTIDDAFISNKPLDHNTFNPLSMVDAGVISLNGVIFNNHLGIPYYYIDTTATIYNTPHVWSVTGAGNLSAFTFTNTNTYPVFTGYSALPDSFQISSGITIPVSYSNVDEMEVLFETSTGNQTNAKYVAGNVSSIPFSASELSAIGTGKNITLVITFYKNNNQVINGNNHVFRTGYLLRKQNIKFK